MKLAGTLLLALILFCSGTSKAQGFYNASDGEYEQWAIILEDTGDALQIVLPVSAGMITLIKEDFKGTKQLALSFATTMAITHSLKFLIGKRRPEGLGKYDAFPSGHTASAFSAATFIQRRYGWNYGLPAYVLAGIVGVSRVQAPVKRHDYWDVLAGAAVGVSCTYLFTSRYEEPVVEIGFASGGGNYILTFSYQF